MCVLAGAMTPIRIYNISIASNVTLLIPWLSTFFFKISNQQISVLLHFLYWPYDGSTSNAYYWCVHRLSFGFFFLSELTLPFRRTPWTHIGMYGGIGLLEFWSGVVYLRCAGRKFCSLDGAGFEPLWPDDDEFGNMFGSTLSRLSFDFGLKKRFKQFSTHKCILIIKQMNLRLTLAPCSIAFYWVLAVMHCDFYRSLWHFEVNRRDSNTVHRYGTVSHVMRCYFVYCDNIRPLGYTRSAWHFHGHWSDQLDPSMNRVQCHWNPSGFACATQLMSFQRIVPMLRHPLAAISPVVIAAFWHEHALLLSEPWLFPAIEKHWKKLH